MARVQRVVAVAAGASASAWYWLIPLGAVSGPLAYYIGMRLGAMTLLASPSYVWPLMAAGWAIFLPLISLPVLLNRRT